MEDATTKRLLTVREAAERTGLGISTVRTWLREGRLKRVVLGTRSIRIRESELDEYIAERTGT